MATCWKCSGKGYISEYGHIAQGTCFACKGTGKTDTKAKKTTKRDIAKVDGLTTEQSFALWDIWLHGSWVQETPYLNCNTLGEVYRVEITLIRLGLLAFKVIDHVFTFELTTKGESIAKTIKRFK